MSGGELRVRVFAKSDLGRTRDHNEDTFLVADLSARRTWEQAAEREHAVGRRGALFMVADGMGGAAAGEVASAMAAEQIHEYLTAVWLADHDSSPQRFALRMREAVEHANARLHAYASEHPEVRGMGTTVTAAGVLGGELYLTQIGDSRAYLLRNGRAIQLTKDQSLMQRLVDAGEMTEEEAEQSERRNIILQALGPDARVKVDLTYQSLRRGDVLVLCSDGLSTLVRKDEIAALVADGKDLSAACTALIDLANTRGGPDNITIVAARFDGDGLVEPDADGYADVRYQVYPCPEGDVPCDPPPVAARDAARRSAASPSVALVVLLVVLGLAAAAFFAIR